MAGGVAGGAVGGVEVDRLANWLVCAHWQLPGHLAAVAVL